MEEKINKVLVTGSNGYIGSVLVPLLLQEGYDVECLDMGYFNDNHVDPAKRYLFNPRDVRDLTHISLDGIDAIIHLAALSNDPLGDLDEKLTDNINWYSTTDLAYLARAYGVKRFIFSSSCSVYGHTDDYVNEESQCHYQTAYARCKLYAEQEIKRDLWNENFTPIFLRNATVYGTAPMLRSDLIINKLVMLAHSAGKLKLESDGMAWRPLIGVEDLANIFMLMLSAPKHQVAGQIFNIGSNDQNYLILDVLNKVAEHFPGCDVEIGNKFTDTRTYKVNFDKFTSVFNYKFKYTLDEEIERLKAMCQQYNFTEADISRFSRLDTIKKLMNEGKLTDSLRWRF